MWENIFIDISLVIVLAVGISYIMSFLKQPLIIGYIITGLIVSLTWIVQPSWEMTILSQIGVVLLLFMLGLNMNPKILKEVGKVSLLTWVWQVVFTSIIWFWVLLVLWFDNITSAYIAIAITFSSTIVIMKLLSDKWDLNTLYGKISIWFLIVQDVIAMLILMFITFWSWWWNVWTVLFQVLAQWVWLAIWMVLIGIYVLPKVTKQIAKSQEFLELFAIWRCLLLASVFYLAWFSIEIWALIAWITLSFSPYRFEISSKMKSLRDFFIVIFFVLFGTHMTLNNIWWYALPIIILSLFILVWNPIIVMAIMGKLGYTKKISFKAWLTVAQISEFSFILIILWANLWHISKDILSVISIIWLITIAGSTYFILYSDKLYNLLSPYLSVFEKKWAKKLENKAENTYEVILFWYDIVSFEPINALEKIKKEYLIVEYNPEIIKYLEERKINCMYGDASNIELLDEIAHDNVKMIISASKDIQTNSLLIDKFKTINDGCIVIVTATTIQEAIKLYEKGASYVIIPNFVWWLHVSNLIQNYELNVHEFTEHKNIHFQRIKEIETYKTNPSN